MKVKFTTDSPHGASLMEWWQGLERDHGSRAELRRCRDVGAVLISAPYQRLRYKLQDAMQGQWQWQERLARVAGLAAQVREHKPGANLPKAMLGPDPKRPLVSELRFRRLLQREPDELYTAMLRVLRMIGHQADLLDLANAVFNWGEFVKKDWAFAYFPKVKS